MTATPPAPSYLDELFAAMRSFAQQLSAMQSWLTAVRNAPESPWRFQLLVSARASCEGARASLAEVEDRLRSLGPASQMPAPLDQLPKNVAGMHTELATKERELARLEAEMTNNPLGRA